MSAARRRGTTRTARASAAFRDWNARLIEDAEDGTRRGTRWGRGTCAFLPATVGVGVLGSAIASGAMAANLAVLSGTQFTLQSNNVIGTGFGAVLDTPNVTDPATGTTSTPANARIGFAKAQLSGFCEIVNESLGGVSVTLAITAGAKVNLNPGTPWPAPTNDVTATGLYIETKDLAAIGSTTLTNATLGASADTVTVDNKLMSTGINNNLTTKGLFGLAADNGNVVLQGLNTKATDAELIGSISLPNLHIQVGGTC